MDIQVYADKANISPNSHETVLVNLDNVSIDDVLAEFNTKDILQSLEFSDVAQFVSDSNKEADDERSY